MSVALIAHRLHLSRAPALCTGSGLLLALCAPGAAVPGAEPTVAAGVAIQLDLGPLLNARPVTTLTGGALVSWNGGIDGNGHGDGYLTMAAALANGDRNAHALPDNATFPATPRHPELVLHYANGDGDGKQAHAVSGAGEFTVAVPANRYSGLFLALTSAEGESRLHWTLTYADGATAGDVVCPDYYKDLPADDPDLSYLVSDLAKWNRSNAMAEKNHHNIDALDLHPDAGRTLVRVTVAKAAGGYLVLWGAAGVVAGP